ncbi:MAG: GGDEF domain-containing protein [Lachnospiraceae bacterium]|nr:GGDEF domain-containing protein [Lachnospiraceae bacterium]
MKKVKYPIRHSITIASVTFIATLAIILTVVNYNSFKSAFYDDYKSYIDEILSLSISQIDHGELKHCVDTKEETDEFFRMRDYMDNLMECMEIDALYVLSPCTDENGRKTFMSVISAEDNYNRYEDTEGNLWLGYVLSEDEYDDDTINNLYGMMEDEETKYFVETTEWGTDYTGVRPLLDSSGECYALLCVDIEVSEIDKIVKRNAMKNMVIIALVGLLYTIFFITMTNKYVSNPLMKLQKSVTEYAENCSGVRESKHLYYEDPNIKTKNEMEALSDAVIVMTESIEEYVKDVASAEMKAESMEYLANKDALTNVRNKTAYDKYLEHMEQDLANEEFPFGIAMIDLNFLKKINDSYGHEYGDKAIKKLCDIVCNIFTHSPVFRIGGDEFVVVLKGRDHDDREKLMQEFREKINTLSNDESFEIWDRISAAIGYAEYDKNTDHEIIDVFRRADKEMYENKKAMKAVREV